MMQEEEAAATVRRMTILSQCVACLFVALVILVLGDNGLPRPTYRTVLRTAIVLTICGILMRFIKLTKRMEQYEEEPIGR